MSRIVTLIGATGLIGGKLLELLLKDRRTYTVRALVRKTFVSDHPRLQQFVINFNLKELCIRIINFSYKTLI